MFLVPAYGHDPAWNLALEEYLFHLAARTGRSFVRLWRNAPSIIVGRFQNTAEEIDEAAVLREGVTVVRRLTGGGAVYHDLANLNYTLVATHDNLAEFDFRALAEPILRTLRGLGVAAELSGRNDLTVDGRKFSGTAQHAGQASVLYHGTLLYDTDLTRLERLLRPAPDKFLSKGFQSVRSRVTNLKDWLPPGCTLGRLEEELRRELAALTAYDLTAADLAAVEALTRAKYAAWSWNWGESPEFTVRRERRFPWGRASLRLKVTDGFIVEARLFGDFFGRDLELLEKSLAGLPYTAAALEEALERLDPARFIAGAAPQDLRGLAFLDEDSLSRS